jgi:hypothetical protein
VIEKLFFKNKIQLFMTMVFGIGLLKGSGDPIALE